MSLEVLQAMIKPDVNGAPSLPKRSAPKGLLPSTWLNRSLKIEYRDCFGAGQQTSGVLLDCYPAGVVIGMGATKSLLSWDAITYFELIPD